MNIYDVAIIGGGPAGYTAGIYCARAGLKTVIFEQALAGGQMTTTENIENYPGFLESVAGSKLGENMKISSEKFGTKTINEEVIDIKINDNQKVIITKKNEYNCNAIIIATGAVPRRLEIDNEKNLIGKGLSYCATCDGMFFKNKTVVVIGGGNSAAEDATTLSRLCKKVYIIHRRDKLRASNSYLNALENAKNVEVVYNAKLTKINSKELITSVEIKLVNENRVIDCEGVFVAIGRIPNNSIVDGKLLLDKTGYIVADETTKTNINGVFAAGDIRTKPLRQIVTACADGATASYFAEEYIKSLNN